MIYSKELDLDLYRMMKKIREFELCASEIYARSRNIKGTLHLCIGQEAVAVGVCKALGENDYIVTTHRGHGHMIAKGADLKQMAAELLGKSTGCCGGKGGSMHISDFSIGGLVANAILGSGFTIATGSAFASRYLHKNNITVCFFGDGAFSEGTLHEALNISAIWKLPILFVCENNQYALSTPYKKTIAIQDLSKIAVPYQIPSLTIDGNSVLEVYQTVLDYVNKVRINPFPMFLECKTYRTCGHYESETEDVYYRSGNEIDYWKNKDPIINFRRYLESRKDICENEIQIIESEVSKEILEAYNFAEKSNFPNCKEALLNVYSNIEAKGR